MSLQDCEQTVCGQLQESIQQRPKGVNTRWEGSLSWISEYICGLVRGPKHPTATATALTVAASATDNSNCSRTRGIFDQFCINQQKSKKKKKKRRLKGAEVSSCLCVWVDCMRDTSGTSSYVHQTVQHVIFIRSISMPCDVCVPAANDASQVVPYRLLSQDREESTHKFVVTTTAVRRLRKETIYFLLKYLSVVSCVQDFARCFPFLWIRVTRIIQSQKNCLADGRILFSENFRR